MDLVIRSFSYERQPRIFNYSPISTTPDPNAESDVGKTSAILGGLTEPVDPNLKNQHLNEYLLGFEHEVLPHYLPERRWFAEKARRLPVTQLQSLIPLDHKGMSAALGVIAVGNGRQGASRYLLPLVVRWTRLDRVAAPLPNAVAAVRRGPREGTLLDAAIEPEFVGLLLKAMHSGEPIGQGEHLLEGG